ncbi:glycoside hydrolase family 71 protein [Lentinula edodes]|uniref:Glycoside hydrolase family 71 protein n=1 Tax=Lentinula edodes TaxID=5353 RepID=A0A1Q3E1P4_LENED|nr:glycoside hydrolase family 71 protein [Lentinula edodes]
MVGNTFPYTSQDWLNDVKLAHSSGIDGFALNMGIDDWQPARVADAYAAAQTSSLDFKMFLSLDIILPCSTANDAASLRTLVTTYLSHPNQLRYTRGSSEQLPLVSTFAGESCKFGQASVVDGWRSQFTQHPDLQGKMTFVPSFFVAPNQMSQFQGVVDGTFNWNGGWPVELTTDSTGSSSNSLSSTLKNLLGVNTTTNAIGKFSNLLGTGETSSSSDTASGLLSLEDALSNFIGSTDSDSQFLNASIGNTSNNVYIAAVSPWFFTHFGKNSFNKNFLYLADQHLYSKRWESLIPAQVPLGTDSDLNATSIQPSISEQVDIVEIISWNDYGESHYVGPIEGALPTGSEVWTDGMNHTAWLSLTSYYASAFKAGTYPSVSSNEERVVVWSRTHPASADATSDTVGSVPGSELVLDAMWAVTLLSQPANVTLQIIPSSSNSSTDSPLAQQSFSVPAGLRQAALESARILVIPATATATSILKNLVLPGLGHFTVMDDKAVTGADAGNNFFLDGSKSIGKSRAEEAVKGLMEMNDGVEGVADVRDIDEVLKNDQGWLKSFNIVVAHNGFLLNFLFIIGNTKAFPALLEYAMSLPLDTMDITDHAHIPFPVILVRALEEWRREREQVTGPSSGIGSPRTSAEKKAFKERIRAMMRKFDEENFEEAEAQAFKCWTPTVVPSEVRELFTLYSLSKPSSSTSSSFAALISALSQFVQNNPASPQYTSGRNRKRRNVFLKNSHALKVLKGREWKDINPGSKELLADKLSTNPKEAAIHLALAAARKLRAQGVLPLLDPTSGPNNTSIKGILDQKNLKDLLTAEVRTFLPPGTELPEADWSIISGEIARAPSADLPTTAAFLGGLVAQEVIKMITKQYIPISAGNAASTANEQMGICVIDLVETWTGIL